MRQLGYLGKVPHRGDFVRYNVATHLHRVWDDWLGETLLQAAETLDGWPDGYDAAAPWQFVLSPDLAGDEARAGVLFASRDSVGRRYPFALFATLPETITPLETLAGDPALDALERLARCALDEASAYEGLKAALGELQRTLIEPAPDPAAAPFRPGTSTRAAEPAVFSEDAELLADRAGTIRLLDAVLRQSTGPYSVWRRRDTAAADGRLLVSGGLPRDAAAFVLFGAEWSARAGGRLDGSARTDTRRPQALPGSAIGTAIGTATAAATAAETAAESAAEMATVAASAVATAAAAVETAAAPTRASHSPDAVERASQAEPEPEPEPERDPEPASAAVTEAATAAGSGGDVGSPPDAEPPERVAPLEVETLSIDEEEGDAPWDSP